MRWAAGDAASSRKTQNSQTVEVTLHAAQIGKLKACFPQLGQGKVLQARQAADERGIITQKHRQGALGTPRSTTSQQRQTMPGSRQQKGVRVQRAVAMLTAFEALS